MKNKNKIKLKTSTQLLTAAPSLTLFCWSTLTPWVTRYSITGVWPCLAAQYIEQPFSKGAKAAGNACWCMR